MDNSFDMSYICNLFKLEENPLNSKPEMEAYLENLPNKSKFIREAVAEKIERESKKKE